MKIKLFNIASPFHYLWVVISCKIWFLSLLSILFSCSFQIKILTQQTIGMIYIFKFQQKQAKWTYFFFLIWDFPEFFIIKNVSLFSIAHINNLSAVPNYHHHMNICPIKQGVLFMKVASPMASESHDPQQRFSK